MSSECKKSDRLEIYFAPESAEDANPDERTQPRLAIQSPLGRFFKRSLDIGLALPIVVMILPLLCIFFRLIHLFQSSGPLFYRQVRCGRDKQPFTIYKFRTMDVPDSGACEIKDAEVRIFPIGDLLRAAKIDEFPQFLNVLSGAMSVVGPRPHHFDDCEAFGKLVADYPKRTIAKPGITGLAQFEEYDGRFEWNCIESRVVNDLKYIHEWSPATDLMLIFQTGAVVFRKVLRDAIRKTFGSPLAPAFLDAGKPELLETEATGRENEASDRKAA